MIIFLEIIVVILAILSLRLFIKTRKTGEKKKLLIIFLILLMVLQVIVLGLLQIARSLAQ